GIGGAFLAAGEVIYRVGTEVHELYNKWLNVDEAVDEYNKKLADAVIKSALNVSSIEEAVSGLKFSNAELAKYEDTRLRLNKHNRETSITQDPLDFFLSKSYEKDALTGQLETKLEIFNREKTVIEEQSKMTESLIGQEKQLNDIRLQGLP